MNYLDCENPYLFICKLASFLRKARYVGFVCPRLCFGLCYVCRAASDMDRKHLSKGEAVKHHSGFVIWRNETVLSAVELPDHRPSVSFVDLLPADQIPTTGNETWP